MLIRTMCITYILHHFIFSGIVMLMYVTYSQRGVFAVKISYLTFTEGLYATVLRYLKVLVFGFALWSLFVNFAFSTRFLC